MQQYSLSVTTRESTGKGPNRRLRAEGKLPAVLYGTDGKSELIGLDYREFQRTLAKPDARNGLFSLKGDGREDALAVIREVQRDPLSRQYLHVDFYRVRMDQESNFDVPVHSVGNPIGVKEGGILETHIRTITVRCLPGNIPNYFEVDLTGLRVNSSIHVSDLKIPEGVSLVTSGEEVLFNVLPPKGEKAAGDAEGPQQPEVIGRKKEDEK